MIALKSPFTAKTLGHPAGKRLVLRPRGDRRAYRMRYHRRPGIDGMFGGFKTRFGGRAKAR